MYRWTDRLDIPVGVNSERVRGRHRGQNLEMDYQDQPVQIFGLSHLAILTKTSLKCIVKILSSLVNFILNSQNFKVFGYTCITG